MPVPRRACNIIIIFLIIFFIIVTMTKVLQLHDTVFNIKVYMTSSASRPCEERKKSQRGTVDRAVLRLNWPIFPGADSRIANSQTSKPDPLLLAKIQANMDLLKTPIFRRKSDTNNSTWKFPRIFHQSWKSEKIPNMTAQWVRKWLEIHPDWTYIFWTDKAARQFVSKYFPSLLEHYDSWRYPVERADMFRYIAVYAFGGVWGDMDMEPLKSLEPIRDWSSCILSREPDLQTKVMSSLNSYANNYTFTCNAFFACRAHHPFMFYMISRTVAKSPLIIERQCRLDELIQCTGPWLMSWTYAYYRRSLPEQFRREHPEYDVICPEYEYFLPTFDNTRISMVKAKCAQPEEQLTNDQKDACRVFRARNETNEPLNYSYTNHHWFHSYHYDVGKSSVNIHNATKFTRYTDPMFEVSYE